MNWFVCFLVGVVFHQCVAQFELPEYEYLALYDLYNATNGDYWTWGSSRSGNQWWFFQYANPCMDNWQGVTCTSDGSTLHVSVLSLFGYNLNGTIPESLGALSYLQRLNLGQNELIGSIPSSFANLMTISILDLSDNKLDGTIPNFITTLSFMERLYLNNNKLTGTIPALIGQLGALNYFICNDNRITGTIPGGMFNLTNLEYLYVQGNFISGVLSELLSRSVQVLNLNFSSNYFTGSLPNSWNSLQRMQQLSLSNNIFTGTVPASIGEALSLSQFDISNSYIEGTLPPSMQNLTNLITLSVQNCYLSGPIEQIFSPNQTQLTAIQLDNNVFTGTLPEALFALPALVSVSLVGTCITGSLPDNICDAVNLQALVMYGLTTATSCRSTGLQALSTRRNTFGSAFPACLLSLPAIRTILLSSNGLTGRLHSDWPTSRTLSQLDLSHNALSGSIPDSIQNNTRWSLLDLSHNKLSGSLHAGLFEVANKTAVVAPQNLPVLTLNTNRLSGVVPGTVNAVQNLSVLAGNLFYCDTKSDLPQHDDGLATYECASNSFNEAYYVWLALCAAVALVLAGVLVRGQYALPSAILSVSAAYSAQLKDLHIVLDKYRAVHKYAWHCALFCVVILLPYYAIIHLYEGTHTHQYAYVVSAIYVSGVDAFAISFVLFAVLPVMLYVRVCTKHFKALVAATTPDADTVLRRACVWVIYAVINTGVVVGVNVGYVNIILFGDSQGRVPAQIALSLFKLVWGNVASPFMIRHLGVQFFPARTDNLESFFVLQLVVALFNNIAIPCLVVAAIDPNCFSDILLPPEAQFVTYLLPVCFSPVIEEQCTSFVFQTSTLKFTPPFVYSYQCSASFITSYAPAFVYMSISTVFLNPLLQYVLLGLYRRWQPSGGWLFEAVSAVLPRLLKPAPVDVPPSSDVRLRPYVGAVGTLINLLTQLGILLTFGVIFPPVALAMAVSISAVAYMSLVKVRWFVDSVIESNQLEYLGLINAECAGVGTTDQMVYAVEIIICYCCAFYTLFEFDALGDTQGFAASIWVLIVVPLAPYTAFAAMKVYSAIYARCGGTAVTLESGADESSVCKGDEEGEVAVELATINVVHENFA